MEPEAGRNFPKEYKTDERGILLNENAARLLGFEDISKATLITISSQAIKAAIANPVKSLRSQ